MPIAIELLRRRASFRRLWLAGIVSLVGDWLSFVAIAVLSLESSEGPLALATTLAVHQLPAALLGPLAGTLADRVDRRRILIVANLVQATLTLLAVFAAAHSVLAVQCLVFLRSATASFLVPAETAAVRRTVDDTELADANALLATTWSLSFVVGMALGGPLAELGAPVALALDACTFVLAAALVVKVPPIVPERDVPRSFSLFGELREALALAHDEPRLVPVLAAKIPPALAWGAAWLALHLVSESSMPFGPAAISIGVLQAVRGAGTGIGPIAARSLERRGVRAVPLLAGALALLAVAVPTLTLAQTPLVLACAALVWGMGSGSIWVASSTLLSRIAGDARIGRLTALDELANVLAMQLSALFVATAVTLGATPAEAAVVPVVAMTLLGAVVLRALSRASR